MNADLEKKVQEAVDELTNNGSLFTAYDVTLMLRNQGEVVYHHEVREFIVDLFNNMMLPLDYIRTSYEVKQGIFAFVYHPSYETDLSKYNADRNKSNVPFVKQVTPVSVPANFPAPPSKPAGMSSTDAVCNAVSFMTKGYVAWPPDKRGRLCIFADLLRSVGLNPGDSCFVVPSHNKVTIGHCGGAYYAGQTAYSYKVDKDNNVRISNKILSKAFVTSGAYDMRVENGTVVVEAV